MFVLIKQCYTKSAGILNEYYYEVFRGVIRMSNLWWNILWELYKLQVQCWLLNFKTLDLKLRGGQQYIK